MSKNCKYILALEEAHFSVKDVSATFTGMIIENDIKKPALKSKKGDCFLYRTKVVNLFVILGVDSSQISKKFTVTTNKSIKTLKSDLE